MEQNPGLKFIFGGGGCMVAACFTNPIDVIKVRMQLQGELGAAKAGYNNMFSGLAKIFAEEGPRGLQKGLSASLMREGSYSSIRMGAYEPFKEIFGAQDPANTPLYKKVAAGASSGAIGAALCNPADLVKVRFQSAGPGSVRYPTLRSAFKTIYETEGLAGLWKGWAPNTQRAALLTASQLPAYDHFKHTVLNYGVMEEGRTLHFTSSMFAGFVCAVTTSPIDNVKTRIMNQTGNMYSGVADCLSKTVQAEGVLGLYKGFFPQWLRIGPHTIISFLAFEQFRAWFGMAPI